MPLKRGKADAKPLSSNNQPGEKMWLVLPNWAQQTSKEGKKLALVHTASAGGVVGICVAIWRGEQVSSDRKMGG